MENSEDFDRRAKDSSRRIEDAVSTYQITAMTTSDKEVKGYALDVLKKVIDRERMIGFNHQVFIDDYMIGEPKLSLGSEEVRHRSYEATTSFIDLILKPDDADEVVGDLKQGYEKRLVKSRGHAARWIWMQTVWISVDRAFDLIRRFALAKAGK